MPNMKTQEINPLYPNDKRLLANQIKKIEDSAKLTEQNRDLLKQFILRCQGAGICNLRIVFYANRMRQVTEILGKDFKEATRTDFERVMAEMQGKGYSDHTIDAFIASLKAFTRWVYGLGKREELPKSVNWIERRRPPNELKAEDLLTDAEVNRLIRGTDDPMLKTMVGILYEGALRPEELRGLRVSDVHLNGSTVKLYVAGKMAKREGRRVVFLARSYPLVMDWLALRNGGPDDWLFPDPKDKSMPINYSTFRQSLYRLAKNIVPKKKVWPYLFRHTTGTWIYTVFPAPIARQLMGHAPGSKMEGVYVHLGMGDLEIAVQEQYNLKGEHTPVKKGVCVKCSNVLYLGDNCCRKCGLAENTKAAFEKDVEEQITNFTMNVLMDDPQIKTRILELRQGIREKLGLEATP